MLCKLYQSGGLSTTSRTLKHNAPTLQECHVDLFKRHHLGRFRAIGVEPHCGEIDKRITFCFACPRFGNGAGRASDSFGKLCELRFDVDIKMEKACAERCVLWHQHLSDDFFALDKM
ncbi:hypothetical protein WK80_02295 [Burkholderia multivorans]|nr:hypothetical protein WK80_02295 [Burkholderia multivorans]